MKKQILILFLLILVMFLTAQPTEWKGKSVDFSHGDLKIHPNNRYLMFEDGTHFFYLGDTAWELFHRLNKEESEIYLENRRKKGFTVIQAVILAEQNGLNIPNAEGERPFIDNDPAKINEAYFKHVDWVIKKAEEKGLFVGVLPTWGDKWSKTPGGGPVFFNPDNSAEYGEFIGQRYKDAPNVIWILGGDRFVENEEHENILNAMAKGLRKGDNGKHLITFHPRGGRSSADYFHESDWLDFNMRQNGHSPNFTNIYSHTSIDYNRQPAKPVVDGEALYEDFPIEFNGERNGHATSADVRRPMYWNLFTGAFGHTYGHNSVWQMWQPGKSPDMKPLFSPVMPWYEALEQPGAFQVIYGRKLIESRPFFSRIPDDSIIATHNITTLFPGAGRYRFVATRDQEGTYAMVYAPVSRPFAVRMDVIKGNDVKAWWYNPRNGKAQKIGKFSNRGVQTFTPPDVGENLDWILVLDDARKKYPKPGKLKKKSFTSK